MTVISGLELHSPHFPVLTEFKRVYTAFWVIVSHPTTTLPQTKSRKPFFNVISRRNTNELQSLLTPVQAFTAKTRYTAYTRLNHLIFSYFINKKEISFQNCYFLEQRKKWEKLCFSILTEIKMQLRRKTDLWRFWRRLCDRTSVSKVVCYLSCWRFRWITFHIGIS